LLGCLQHAAAYRHNFFTNAVSGNDSYVVFTHG
jgi:hypothetical protein